MKCFPYASPNTLLSFTVLTLDFHAAFNQSSQLFGQSIKFWVLKYYDVNFIGMKFRGLMTMDMFMDT